MSILARSSLRSITASSSRLLPITGRYASSSAGPSTVSSSEVSDLTSSSFSTTPIETASIQGYNVVRSENGELPVYSKVRNGRGWKTILRKVEGDVKALQTSLNEYFEASNIDPIRPAPRWSIRPTNKHLEVKGRWVNETKGFLENQGF